jgi:hypothetical protein
MNQPGNPVIAFAYLAIATRTGGRGPPGQMKGTLGTSNGCVVQCTDFGALGRRGIRCTRFRAFLRDTDTPATPAVTGRDSAARRAGLKPMPPGAGLILRRVVVAAAWCPRHDHGSRREVALNILVGPEHVRPGAR